MDNHSDLLATLNTIIMGNAAQSSLDNDVGYILTRRNAYLKARAKDWNAIESAWMYSRPDNILFACDWVDSVSAEDAAATTLSVKTCTNHYDGTERRTIEIPSAWLWLSDEQLDAEVFEPLWNTAWERVLKGRAAAEAEERAKYEKLKARFGA